MNKESNLRFSSEAINSFTSVSNLLASSSSNLGISIFSSAISTSPKYTNENEYLNVAESDIIWAKIKSIKQLEAQHVYDLAIEGTRNFIANDIVAHNTYLATSSGNVGIGTTSPNDILEAVGNVRISGSLNATNINASRAYAGNGTAALPSYTFIEDTDTGIINSGKFGNNISIVTGGSARMTIDSSGNVGIGTASPTSKLHTIGNVTIIGNLTMGTGQSDAVNITAYSPDGTVFRCGPNNAGTFECSN